PSGRFLCRSLAYAHSTMRTERWPCRHVLNPCTWAAGPNLVGAPDRSTVAQFLVVGELCPAVVVVCLTCDRLTDLIADHEYRVVVEQCRCEVVQTVSAHDVGDLEVIHRNAKEVSST